MRIIIHILFITTLVISRFSVLAQEISVNKPILLHVERGNYISGDAILFDVYLHQGIFNVGRQVPDVYVDLLTLNNIWIDGVIVQQNKGLASGTLPIPDSLKSGVYLVRAYCRYPFKNNQAFIQKIQVTNRFSTMSEKVINDTTFNSIYLNKLNLFNPLTDTFSTRDKIQLKISKPKNKIIGSVAVIKRNQWIEKQKSGYRYTNIDTSVCIPENTDAYSGIVVCGKAIDARTQKPISNAVVLISTEDSVIRLNYHFTNSMGEFQIHLHECYNLQKRFFNVFTYPEMEPIFTALVQINSPFDKPGKQTVDINSDEINIPDSSEISKSIIAKAYEIQNLKFKDGPNMPSVNYEQNMLGADFNTVNVDDFITLNSFAEISKEILPLVKIKNTKIGPTIHVIGEVGKTNVVTNNPLVLVDGVPLTNIEKIIDWGSNKIHHVDVQRKQRYYGDLWLRNGIICIWTRKRDFWSQTTISGTYKVSLSGFQQAASFITPDYSKTNNKTMPDFRQVIFWKPEIEILPNDEAEINFATSDEKGDFVVEFFGIDDKGAIVFDTIFYTVK